MEKSILLLITLSLISISCNSDRTKEIKVGMTYEEVVTILDKPIAIFRGAPQLTEDMNSIPIDILKGLIIDTSQVGDPKRWYAPKMVVRVGSLIYVTWAYEKTKMDTFYIVLNFFKNITDSIHYVKPSYYLGSRKVSREQFLASDGYEYRDMDGDKTTKRLYDIFKKSGRYKLPAPSPIKKRLVNENKISFTTKRIVDSTEKKYYVVFYRYLVIFDASSGRVTESGYFPIDVRAR